MILKRKIITLILGIICSSGLAIAAPSNSEDLEVINLEDLYNKEQTQPVRQQKINTENSDLSTTTTTETTTTEIAQPSDATVTTETTTIESGAQQKAPPVKVRDLKDLNQLVPFSEVSVIQKKFMPKSERFQLFLGAGITTNTPWFTNYGAKLNLSYNFTESIGLELNTLFLTSSPRQVANEILEEHDIQADQFIYTKGYYGLDFVWSPIYGKLAFNNESIVNYEMYFSIGGGQSNTNSLEKNVTTIHLAVGQIFALSKSFAFRWDYGFSMFEATPVITSSGGTTTSGIGTKNLYNDLVLTAGFSFFFPEVNYR